MNDILKCIPKYEKKGLAYFREEPSGGAVFVSRKHPELQQLQMNEISINISNMCDGTKDIDAIVTSIVNEYEGAARNQVEMDVQRVLINLWRLGIVSWVDKTPYDIIFAKQKGEVKYKLLSEEEVIDRLNESIKKGYSYPFVDRDITLCDTTLRQKVFGIYEIFFSIAMEGIEKMIVSFSQVQNTKTIEVNSISGEVFIEDRDLMKDFLIWCKEKISQLKSSKDEILKIRFFNVQNQDDDYKEYLARIGFKSIGFLEKELGDESPIIEAFEYNF